MTSPPDDNLDSLLADDPEPPPTPSGTSVRERLLAIRRICSVQLKRRPVQGVAAGVIALLVAVGAVLIFSGSATRKLPPTPPSPAAAAKPVTQVPTDQLTATPSPASTATAPAAAAAPCVPSLLAPVDITIPAIGVHSCLLQLGLNADKTVQTPTLQQVAQAGWYKYSTVPGAVGPSVILGHIDSAEYGPGVFFKLGTLHAGDTVVITRADHQVATFGITQVAEYPKTNFPTALIYGKTTNAALRLITCGGRFDPQTRSYLDNIVAYATLLSLTHT